jgi:hypothetical protein
MQRLIRLQLSRVDHDPRPRHAGEEPPGTCSIDPATVVLKKAAPQPPGSPLGALVQVCPAAEASGGVGQCQARSGHRRHRRVQPHGKTPTTDVVQQPGDAALSNRQGMRSDSRPERQRERRHQSLGEGVKANSGDFDPATSPPGGPGRGVCPR